MSFSAFLTFSLLLSIIFLLIFFAIINIVKILSKKRKATMIEESIKKQNNQYKKFIYSNTWKEINNIINNWPNKGFHFGGGSLLLQFVRFYAII